MLVPRSAGFALSTLLAVAPLAVAQNDECTGALPVTTGTIAFDTTGATLSAPAWPCGGGGGPDLWYVYTATSGVPVTVSLCGSNYDTTLQVFFGDCNALLGFGCNDDFCGQQSQFTFQSLNGADFYLRIGGFNGATGSGTMTISTPTPLANDECAGAIPLMDGATPFSTVGASTSTPAWVCASGGSDIWYSFSAAGTQVDISTCGSGYDTALEVFEGTCGSLTNIACNDDSCGLQSNVTVNTIPGFPYLLRVGGFGGSTGTGTLTVTGTGDGSPGSNYCAANANSTGAAAEMFASGTSVVANNDLVLGAGALPPNTFTVFLASGISGFVPLFGGSDGNLCLQGSIGIYGAPGQVQRSDAGGEATLAIDLSQVPNALGTSALASGDTWYFQAWYRDRSAGGRTTNFSDGLEVTLF